MAVLLLSSSAAAETRSIPSDKVTIDVITVNGSGCKAGTATVIPSPDNTSFRVIYSEYVAAAGADTDPTDFRKNCQVNLRVNSPQGFTYGIAQADYEGFAHLENGATGTQRANYYFQGSSNTAHSTHRFAGPLSDNWQATDTTEWSQIVYAPCGEQRHLNINSSLVVHTGTSDAKNTTSFMTMDSSRGSIETKYHFAWKTCD